MRLREIKAFVEQLVASGGGEVEEFDLAAVAEVYPGSIFWPNQDDTLRVVRQGRVVTAQCALGFNFATSLLVDWQALNPDNPLPASMIPISYVDAAIFWDKRAVGNIDRKQVPGQVEIYTDGIIYLRINPGVDLETSTWAESQFAFSWLVA